MEIISIIFLFFGALFVRRKPSNNRNWSPDQRVLPYAKFNGNNVEVRNIRNFKYKTAHNYEERYYNKTFNINEIKAVYYILEPFRGLRGVAHTFLSFEFKNDEFIAISIEIRKKKGDRFSLIRGMFKGFEIMYVIGDERDLIDLRVNHRKDKVHIYPMKISKEKTQDLFLDMLKRANKLKDKPEFYNTITNTCLTNIVNHTKKASKKNIPYGLNILLPEKSDHLLHKIGFLNTKLSIKMAREKFLINKLAEEHAGDPDFSVKIRSNHA